MRRTGIEGGTTNGYEKQAASFTVTEPAKVTSLVIPLPVVGAAARIEIAIVAAKPWGGTDPANLSGSGSWDNLPDESSVIGQARPEMVGVLQQPCGLPEIVTATFKKPALVSPGAVYWVVLQNPAGATNTFHWIHGIEIATSSTFAQYVVDSNGSRWLSYFPGTFRPSAMRVLGKVGK